MPQTAYINQPGPAQRSSRTTNESNSAFAQAVDQNYRAGYTDKNLFTGNTVKPGTMTGVQNNFQSTAPTGFNYNPAIGQGLAATQQGQAEGFGAGQNQAALVADLQAQAAGRGPSLAQMQLQQATDRNVAQAAGAVAGARGINPALAMRQIGQQQAAMGQQMAGQSAMARLEEQNAARAQLANVLAQQRSGAAQQAQLGTGLFGSAGQLEQGQGNQNLQSQNLNLQAALANQAATNDAAKTNLLANTQAQLGNVQQDGIVKDLIGGVGQAVSSLIPGLASGGPVPGKAPVAGDSPKNDVVPAILSPGEIVVPRTAADDPEKAKAFVAEVLGKKAGKKQPMEYADVLAELAEIKKMLKGSKDE